ncbi:winged helix-turn-helix domain-containing protein [Streptomyces sp. SID12488]|uniref:ArsR/SmtB family transcription factor n=1 Tax=Streptomyces sp. SID12488 TaxID=2706040 RepID=UPI0013DCC09B|nr:winged helix-turn-helix domain-containing protein [Streptomyces sp. SID12488]NEA61292.1 winged helix-turn-helix transcriptional regulator [Streptomyces sp. SID12488]
MLRIHFTDADLARVQVAARPDPLWEICFSLRRFQSRKGLWAYADWHRSAREALYAKGLAPVVRSVLRPLYPGGTYFPDFLTPAEASEGLDAGLEAILDVPRKRVLRELNILDQVNGAPDWTRQLPDITTRKEFVRTIRTYYDVAIRPHRDHMQAHVDADRSARARDLLDGGTDGLLAGLGPYMRWRRPTLEIDYCEDRDLHLDGRSLTLVPSYFCWGGPVSLADSDLPPVLAYPLRHAAPRTDETGAQKARAPLSALLGETRAIILRATATGATTGELARAAGVSAASATRHTTVLRDAGLLVSHRHGPSVLHTLTPPGAALLRAGGQNSRTAPV